MYTLKFLDQYLTDVALTLGYISNVLFNYDASVNLKKAIDEKLDEIEKHPYFFTIHSWKKKHVHEYRKAKVKNYYIFFYVDEDVKDIIIARLVYVGRNLNNIEF